MKELILVKRYNRPMDYMVITMSNDSKIKRYEEELEKLKEELKIEKENRFNFKGEQELIKQSIEKEGRINIKITDIENEINRLRLENKNDQLYPLKNKLSKLENQLSEYEEKLTQATYEEEEIEYKFQIKVLNEEIEQLKEEIIDKIEEIEEQKRIEEKRQEEEKKKDLLYKKLYVELSDDNLTIICQILREKNLFYSLYNKKLPIELSYEHLDDKHEFIKKLIDEFSEKEIWDLLKWEEQLELKINSFLYEFKEEDILLLKEKNTDTSKDIIIQYFRDGHTSKEYFAELINEEKEWAEAAKRWAIKKSMKEIQEEYSPNEIFLLKNKLNIEENDVVQIFQYYLERYGNSAVKIIRKDIEKVKEEKEEKEKRIREEIERKEKRIREEIERKEKEKQLMIKKITEEFDSNDLYLLQKKTDLVIAYPEKIVEYYFNKFGENEAKKIIKKEIMEEKSIVKKREWRLNGN